MITGVLAPIAVLGGIALIVVLFLQRGREGVDLSPCGVLRVYLYLASVAGIVLLPTGIYEALSNVLLATPENYFRQGADALGGGIVSLPLWLTYLRLVVSEFRPNA